MVNMRFPLFVKQEHLIVIELKGVIDSDFLYKCKSESCRLLVSFANKYFSKPFWQYVEETIKIEINIAYYGP